MVMMIEPGTETTVMEPEITLDPKPEDVAAQENR